MAEITVYPATLRWAVKTGNIDLSAVSAKRGLTNFPQWLDADEPVRLSFSKLSDLCKALHMPFGSLVRSAIPEQDEDDVIQYRTIGNRNVEPSRNLQDTIRLMRNRQDWTRDELSALGFDGNQLVGSVDSTVSAEELAHAIREKLQLDDAWSLRKTMKGRFDYIRRHAGEHGLMVMVDSRVGTSRRRLDVREFRAFVLLDAMAPLIFINRNDSFSAMLFSLIHEIGHVLLGSSEIFNAGDTWDGGSRVERLINQAVARVVVEDHEFRAYWEESGRGNADVPSVAAACADRYGLSALTMVIHARCLGLATENDVRLVKEEAELHTGVDRGAGPSGGNQNKTNAFHLDSGFVELVHSAIERGALGYTDGFSLLGVKSIQAYDGLLQAKGLVK